MSAAHAEAHAAPHDLTESTPVQTSKLGIWIFLAGEVLVFGGFIATFLLYRFANPSWHESAKELNVWIGTFNTIVLLTSSYTMVLAHRDADLGKGAKAKLWLWLTVGFGLLFCVVKAFEWNAKFHHGIYPTSGRFWNFYFTMTGLHALHLVVGALLNFLLAITKTDLLVGIRRARVEVSALYWHFVDVVWIFLFPLFYLA